MKRRKRTTTVTFETERILIISDATNARCEVCGGRTALVSLNEAARHAGVSESSLYRYVEAQGSHFSETADGHLRICLEAIIRR